MNENINASIQSLKSYPMMPLSQNKIAKSRMNTRANPSVKSSTLNQENVILSEDLSEMNLKFTSIIDNLKNLVTEFESMQNKVIGIQNRVVVLEQKQTEADCATNLLKNKVTELENKIKKLEEAPLRNENHYTNEKSFANVLKSSAPIVELQSNISGLQQEKLNCDLFMNGDLVKHSIGEPIQGENLLPTVKDLLKEITNLNINNVKIVQCFRAKNSPYALRIQLDSSNARSEIFRNFFLMKDKPFFLNEVLIPEKYNLLKKMRKLKSDLNVKHVKFFRSLFVRRGEIFYVLHENVQIVKKVS